DMPVCLREPVVGGEDDLAFELAEPLLEQPVDACERILEPLIAEAANVADLVHGREDGEHDLAALAQPTTELPRGAMVGLAPQVRKVRERPDRVAAELPALWQVLVDRARGGPRGPGDNRDHPPVQLPSSARGA